MLDDSYVCYTAGDFKGGEKEAALPNCRLAAAVTHWRQVFDFAPKDTCRNTTGS
jgi:hypothetical protein